jgi:hypothetical protein
MKEIVIVFFAVMAVASFIAPRLGLAFLWFTIWLYPVRAMYGTLPFDARLSDLWVVYMALLGVLQGRLDRRHHRLLLLACLWSAAILAGDVSGYLLRGAIDAGPLLKDAVKAAYVPLTVFALLSFLRTEQDVRSHLLGFSAAAAAAGALGVLMVHFPTELDLFSIPKDGLPWQASVIEAIPLVTRRARGAVGESILAQVSLAGLLLGLCVAVERLPFRLRAAHVFFALVCSVALIYTGSRGCLTALVCALLWASVGLRNRLGFLVAALAGLGLVLWIGALEDRVLLRFSGAAGGLSEFQDGLQIRFDVARYFTQRVHPSYFLLGVGMPYCEATTHNAYLGAFVYSGALGVAALVACVVTGWRLGGALLAAPPEPLTRALGSVVRMLVVGFAVYALSAENFQTTLPMQVFFGVLALAEVQRTLAANPGLAWRPARANSPAALAPAWPGPREGLDPA